MQQRHRLPSRRTLLKGWGLLMALTLGTMLAGRVTDTNALGFAWVAALLAITWLKARTILDVYLNLRAAPRHWRSGFSGLLAFLLLAILAIYAVHAAGLVPVRPR